MNALTLVITTYNWPNALDLVMQCVSRQSIMPDEIIVADDGSAPQTADVINRFRSIFPHVTIKHCWVPDTANRPAVTRNRAALSASSDYLVYIDGDCLISPNFLFWHRELAERNVIVSGGRLLLNQMQTCQLLKDSNLDYLKELRSFKLFGLRLPGLRKLINNTVDVVRSCNLGIYRSDLIAIKGFDESYLGWAREDTDFVIRCARGGLSIKSGRLACNMAHLYHGGDAGRKSPNEWRLSALLADKTRTDPIKSVFKDH